MNTRLSILIVVMLTSLCFSASAQNETVPVFDYVGASKIDLESVTKIRDEHSSNWKIWAGISVFTITLGAVIAYIQTIQKKYIRHITAIAAVVAAALEQFAFKLQHIEHGGSS